MYIPGLEKYNELLEEILLNKDKKKAGRIKMCRYCETRETGYRGEIGRNTEKNAIYAINKNNELVVNIKGEQSNILINYCPFCGRKLMEEERWI